MVVWQCRSVCGGAGDRTKGLTSAFVDAARAGADFRVDWANPVSITEVLEFRHPQLRLGDRPGNRLGSRRRFIQAIDRPYESCAWRSPLARGETVVVHTNMFATDRERCSGFPFPNGYADMAVVHDVFHFFFRPRPHIVPSPSHGCSLCVHARLGDAAFRGATNRESRVKDLILAIEPPDATGCVYVATDSNLLRGMLAKHRKVRVEPQAPAHVDRGGGRAGLHSTWRSILALASCRTILQLPGRSGFSNTAAAIGDNVTLCHGPCTGPRQVAWIGGG